MSDLPSALVEKFYTRGRAYGLSRYQIGRAEAFFMCFWRSGGGEGMSLEEMMYRVFDTVRLIDQEEFKIEEEEFENGQRD
jgi:hypothetical protein